MKDFFILQENSYDQLNFIFSQIKNLNHELYSRVHIQEYIKKISKNAENYVLLNEQKMCAFASIYINDKVKKESYITLISCFPKETKKGYGSKMLEFLINLSKLRGAKKLLLEVSKNNEVAISFYKKFNFRKISDSEFGYYMELFL